MANQFIGFPVPRARIAEMIEDEAAPIDHHADHENGGSDEVDCTGLTGAGGLTLPWDDIYLNEVIESKNCFASFVGSSGVITETSSGIRIYSGADLNSYARLYKLADCKHPALAWAKKRTFVADVDFQFNDFGDSELFFGTGCTGSARHIGFKVVNGVLYGTCYEAAESSIQLTGGAHDPLYADKYTLKFSYDGAASVKFYVDGVERGEITTNIPAGTQHASYIVYVYCKTHTAGTMGALDMSRYSFYQEA